MDLNTFDLALGINVNLIRYTNEQPIRLTAKSQSKNTPFFFIEFFLTEMDGSIVTPSTLSPEELDRLNETEDNMEEQVKKAEQELAGMKVDK